MAKVLFGDAYDKSLHDQRDSLWYREKELEAEVERLKEALRQVRDITNCSAVDYIARAALAGEVADE